MNQPTALMKEGQQYNGQSLPDIQQAVLFEGRDSH